MEINADSYTHTPTHTDENRDEKKPDANTCQRSQVWQTYEGKSKYMRINTPIHFQTHKMTHIHTHILI